MSTPASDQLLGQTIDGRYRIDSRLARGGMATVYRAADLRLDRPVAVKVLHAHLAEGRGFIDRFRREARAAARLVHPGIVAVHDQGTWGEAPYLVMELVDGPNLRTVMLSHGLPAVGQALDFMAEALSALAAAHNAGLIHRDIKPENILISSTGQVKVADFGLARAVSEVTAASSGIVLGTVAYLSPELVAEGQADQRADVYAAGVVLFELLTGTQPFIGDQPIQVAFQHVHAAFPAPSSRVPWLPQEIDSLVGALTAKDPARRPPDATAALALVKAVRAALPEDVASRAALVGLDQPADSELDDAAVPVPASPEVPAPGSKPRSESNPEPGSEPGPRAPLDRGLGQSSPRLPGLGPTGLSDPGMSAPGPSQGSPQGSPRPPDPETATRGPLGASAGPDSPGSPTTTKAPTAGPSRSRGGGIGQGNPGADQTEMVPTSGHGTGGTTAMPLARILPPAPLSPPPPPTHPRRPRRRLIIWLLVVLALAVAGVGTAYWYFGFGPGSLIAVPNLAGETRQVAEDRLRGLELGSDFELRDSDDVAEGLVIESDPPPSERVKAGTVVNLVVSAGIRMVTIPAEGVVGVDVGLAEAALTEARLDGPVTRELVYDTTVAEGLVLSVEPEGGQSVPHNQAIKLVVSKGPEPIEAPKLTGLTLADAQAAGAEWELTVIQDGEAYSETVAEGLIISQTPNEAEGTYRGRQVTVVVSLGMPFVEVPALRFKTWEQAVAALDAVGLKADQTGVPILGIVQRSDPEAGTSVRKGSTVTVVLV